MNALNRGFFVTAVLAIVGFFVATQWLLQPGCAPRRTGGRYLHRAA